MKKQLLLTFILSALVAATAHLNAQNYKGDSWSKIKSSGSGTLSIIYYEQPGLIQDENGKPKGLCVDVIEDFVAFVQSTYNKKIEVKFVGKETSFSDFLLATQNSSHVLGVTNVTITEDRKKILKFTPSFLTNPAVLISHKNAP
jgi:ABC-type amino acid transport substrate-binding protein